MTTDAGDPEGRRRPPTAGSAGVLGMAGLVVSLLAGLLALPSCYASNVVAQRDRAVTERPLPAAWNPAVAADLDGLYESVDITGDAALALRRIYYWFAGDGSYSGAALVDQDTGPVFQTLNGSWVLESGRLRLDDADAVVVESAPDHLRIAAPNGTLILRKVAAW